MENLHNCANWLCNKSDFFIFSWMIFVDPLAHYWLASFCDPSSSCSTLTYTVPSIPMSMPNPWAQQKSCHLLPQETQGHTGSKLLASVCALTLFYYPSWSSIVHGRDSTPFTRQVRPLVTCPAPIFQTHLLHYPHTLSAFQDDLGSQIFPSALNDIPLI